MTITRGCIRANTMFYDLTIEASFKFNRKSLPEKHDDE